MCTSYSWFALTRTVSASKRDCLVLIIRSSLESVWKYTLFQFQECIIRLQFAKSKLFKWNFHVIIQITDLKKWCISSMTLWFYTFFMIMKHPLFDDCIRMKIFPFKRTSLQAVLIFISRTCSEFEMSLSALLLPVFDFEALLPVLLLMSRFFPLAETASLSLCKTIVGLFLDLSRFGVWLTECFTMLPLKVFFPSTISIGFAALDRPPSGFLPIQP